MAHLVSSTYQKKNISKNTKNDEFPVHKQFLLRSSEIGNNYIRVILPLKIIEIHFKAKTKI